MAGQVDKHRWVVEAHMDTEGNPVGYWLESDSGEAQYLTAEEFDAMQREIKQRKNANTQDT